MGERRRLLQPPRRPLSLPVNELGLQRLVDGVLAVVKERQPVYQLRVAIQVVQLLKERQVRLAVLKLERLERQTLPRRVVARVATRPVAALQHRGENVVEIPRLHPYRGARRRAFVLAVQGATASRHSKLVSRLPTLLPV